MVSIKIVKKEPVVKEIPKKGGDGKWTLTTFLAENEQNEIIECQIFGNAVDMLKQHITDGTPLQVEALQWNDQYKVFNCKIPQASGEKKKPWGGAKEFKIREYHGQSISVEDYMKIVEKVFPKMVQVVGSAATTDIPETILEIAGKMTIQTFILAEQNVVSLSAEGNTQQPATQVKQETSFEKYAADIEAANADDAVNLNAIKTAIIQDTNLTAEEKRDLQVKVVEKRHGKAA